jgi:hypothetical protein
MGPGPDNGLFVFLLVFCGLFVSLCFLKKFIRDGAFIKNGKILAKTKEMD